MQKIICDAHLNGILQSDVAFIADSRSNQVRAWNSVPSLNCFLVQIAITQSRYGSGNSVVIHLIRRAEGKSSCCSDQ